MPFSKFSELHIHVTSRQTLQTFRFEVVTLFPSERQTWTSLFHKQVRRDQPLGCFHSR